MKVLHVITTGDRRGAEMFAADLIPQLTDAGVEQRVAQLRDTSAPPLYAAPTTTLAKARTPTIPVIRLDLAAALALRSVSREWQPDLIQAHGGEPFKYASVAAGRIPIVYRRIGLSPPRVRRGVPNRAYRVLMKRPRCIIAVADAVRQETIDVFGVHADRVVTIPRGVDARRIRSAIGRDRARSRLGIAADAPVVLSLGALSHEKDPLAHLEALDRVRLAMPDAVHLIAGDGSMRDEVERRVRGSGLNGLAQILGRRADVADLLAASDVLLLASRSEGMPGCLIEAGMAGVPVVSYAVAGVPEVVVEGETGYLVPPMDVPGLSNRIVELLSDRELRLRMGTAARERCERTYEISRIAPRYLSIYEEVLG